MCRKFCSLHYQLCASKKTRSYTLWHEIGDTKSPQEINQSLRHEATIWKGCKDHILSKDISININLTIKYRLVSSTVRVTKAVFLSFAFFQSPVCCHLVIQKINMLTFFDSILVSPQCTMLPLSTTICLKSSKLRPILNGQFCHVISKNICLNVLGSKQP